MKLLLVGVLLLATHCTAQHDPSGRLLNPDGQTVRTRFRPPAGYTRQSLPAGTYGAYLQGLSLKAHGSPAYYYNGREKPNPGIYAAVLKMDVGAGDLQQCADAVMRMRAEYLRSIGRSTMISFRFTNGFRADYARWREGYRIAVAGNKASWIKRAAPVDDYAGFRSYLATVFSYAGTRSLSAELEPVPFRQMQIGDVLITGGSPGHAVTVMDMAQTADGRKVFLLSQSYMPAQEIQILHNPDNPAISPWYELPESPGPVRTPQWDFTTGDLKRFRR